MIKVEAWTRTYGDLSAVDQVSFEVGQGEIVGRLGHNGAGKTTIMKMLTGYLEPNGGSIEVDGLNIATQREAVQSRIAYLPANDPLYGELTVIDYLDYAASPHAVPESQRAERIREAIDKTGPGSKTVDTIGTLSRGYRQGVGVARAIRHNPRVLILDEPTNGLDPTQVGHMRELIQSLASHATVILSTHVLQEVQAVCDRVVIIRNGRKALDATMDELCSSHRSLIAPDAEPAPANKLPIRRPKDASHLVLKRSDLDFYFKVAEFAVSPIKDTVREELVQLETDGEKKNQCAVKHWWKHRMQYQNGKMNRRGVHGRGQLWPCSPCGTLFNSVQSDTGEV